MNAALLLCLLLPPMQKPFDQCEGLFAFDLRKPNDQIIHANTAVEWQQVRDWRNADGTVTVVWQGCKESFRLQNLTVAITKRGHKQWLALDGGETCRLERVEWPRMRGLEFVGLQVNGAKTTHYRAAQSPHNWEPCGTVVEWEVADPLARPVTFGPVTVKGK